MTPLIQPFVRSLLHAEELFRADEHILEISAAIDTFADTTLGRGGIGGQMLTDTLTVAIREPRLHCAAIYRAGSLDYVTRLDHPGYNPGNGKHTHRWRHCSWPARLKRGRLPNVVALPDLSDLLDSTRRRDPAPYPSRPLLRPFLHTLLAAEELFRCHDEHLDIRLATQHGSLVAALRHCSHPFTAVFRNAKLDYILHQRPQPDGDPDYPYRWQQCNWLAAPPPDSCPTVSPEELAHAIEAHRDQRRRRRPATVPSRE